MLLWCVSDVSIVVFSFWLSCKDECLSISSLDKKCHICISVMVRCLNYYGHCITHTPDIYISPNSVYQILKGGETNIEGRGQWEGEGGLGDAPQAILQNVSYDPSFVNQHETNKIRNQSHQRLPQIEHEGI